MLTTTLPHLKCPKKKKGKAACTGALRLVAKETIREDVRSGHLECLACKTKFPILSGIAVLVDDVRAYLLEHVKGISKIVLDSEIPPEYLREFRSAKADIRLEHIEDDLEADRVNALYLMNHYLHAENNWWQPRSGKGSPLIDSLVREHWDRGPFAQIEKWIGKSKAPRSAVELGCGVGGLYAVLKPHLKSYLGVDSAFASIALARHLNLGAAYRGVIKIPEDLLQGPTSREVKIAAEKSPDGRADFIVGDIENPPLQSGKWDLALTLNAIDMLVDPAALPKLQSELLHSGGTAISSCPYIWHEAVAKKLRAKLPKTISDSAAAVEWLYEQAGFKVLERVEHLPWLFFKHVRQLEIYSVHLFMANKHIAPARV